MKKSELFFTALLLPFDAIMIFLAFLSAYYLRFFSDGVTYYWPLHQYLVFTFTLLPFWLLIFALSGLYRAKRTQQTWEIFGSFLSACAAGTAVVAAWPLITRQEFFSRLVVLYIFIFTFIFVAVGRLLIRWAQRFLYRFDIGTYHVVIVGTNQAALDLIKQFHINKKLGRRIIGILTNTDQPLGEIAEGITVPRLGDVKDFRKILTDQYIDEIIVTDLRLNRELMLELFDYAAHQGISLKMSPNLLDVYAATIEMTSVAGQPMLELKRTPLDGWGKIAKRVADIVISSLLIIIFSPVMLITALAIAIDSPGPVFFRKLDDGSEAKRVGQYGKPFHYFKFRSMYPNTHNQRYESLAHLNTREDGPMVKIANDPRVTRVGRFIRRWSIDELPELFLVFIGRMSLVGPRPHLPEEVNRYKDHYRRVLILKPGITGMAQISGRSELSFDEEVRFDTSYSENWSLWLDLQILLRTPGAVISSRNRQAI